MTRPREYWGPRRLRFRFVTWLPHLRKAFDLTNPPLHRRFNEKTALEQIRQRYIRCRKGIGPQVIAIQNDRQFLLLADQYYKAGYKDWLILMGILNCMVNWKCQLRYEDMQSGKTGQILHSAFEQIDGDVYPPWRFDKEAMDICIHGFNLTVLKTWGFEIRRYDIPVEATAVSKKVDEHLLN